LEASCEGFWPRKRAHARVEDRIRHAKDCGIGRFPSREYAINTAWALAASIAADLIAWLRLLALPTALATCEPKALRHRFLHVPARLTHGSRRRHLRFPATWPWATDLVAAFTAIRALTPLRTRDPGPSPIRPPKQHPETRPQRHAAPHHALASEPATNAHARLVGHPHERPDLAS